MVSGQGLIWFSPQLYPGKLHFTLPVRLTRITRLDLPVHDDPVTGNGRSEVPLMINFLEVKKLRGGTIQCAKYELERECVMFSKVGLNSQLPEMSEWNGP